MKIRMISLFLSMTLLLIAGSSFVYSQQEQDESRSAIKEEVNAQAVDVIARQKGEVTVIWIKNLKSSMSDIYTLELSFLRTKINSFTNPAEWNANLGMHGTTIEFYTELAPLGPSKTLRLKIITDDTPSKFTWHALGKDGEVGSGDVTATLLFMDRTTRAFPAHDYIYRHDTLVNVASGKSFPVMNWIDIQLSRSYPLLSPREGFEVKRAEFDMVGGDILAFIVAKYIAKDIGFAIENMNWSQGGFVFAPLDSGDEALQYLQLMYHETDASFTGREYNEITSMEEYDETLKKMEEKAKEFESKLEFLRESPTKITRIQEIDGAYSIERVFLKLSESERIIYSNALVHPDGMVELKEEYVFVQGVTGYLLE